MMNKWCPQCMVLAVGGVCPYEGTVPANHDIYDAPDELHALCATVRENNGVLAYQTWVGSLPQPHRRMQLAWHVLGDPVCEAWRVSAEVVRVNALALASTPYFLTERKANG